MLITEEAKTFIQSLQRYIPSPPKTTYQLIIEDSQLRLIPTEGTEFAEYIYEEEEILFGLDAPTQKFLQGRTIILKNICQSTTLELLERRRVPRQSFA